MTYTAEQVIARYVALRDECDQIAKRHAAELKPHHDAMEKLEAWLLATLNGQGADNIKTPQGTAYKSTTLSTKVADWDALWAFIELGHPEFLVHGVNKTAVKEFMDENQGQQPPGVETSWMVKVNVRRS